MQCPGLPTADNDTEKLESRIEAVIAALRPQSHSRQEERGGEKKGVPILAVVYIAAASSFLRLCCVQQL